MDIYHIAVKQTLMNYSYCIMQMSDGHFFYNDVECDTHGYTSVSYTHLTLPTNSLV